MKPHPPSRWYVWTLAALLAAGALALAVDLPLAKLLKEQRELGSGRELRTLLGLSEAFAHGWGVAMIVLAVVLLDPSRRRAWVRLALCVLVPAAATNVVKLLIARLRPTAFFDRGGEVADGVAATFVGLLPKFDPELARQFGHAIQSFPSGHATAAAGLAVGLASLYPHGRWLFLALAVLACGQRLESGAHYLSDVLIGSAIAVGLAGLLVDRAARPDGWLGRYERGGRLWEARRADRRPG